MPSLTGNLPNIRQLYTAEDGYELIQADKKQLELRVMAAVAKDEVLEQALLSGDVYSEDAKAIFGNSLITEARLRQELGLRPDNHNTWKELIELAKSSRPPEFLPNIVASLKKCGCKPVCVSKDMHIKDSARHTSKTGHLAFQYGCGLPKFHMQMLEADQSITWKLSETVFYALRKRYWRTVEYWKEEMARVRRNCHSETRILFNRRSYPALPDLSEVANFPIQGTAAEILNLEIIILDELLRAKYPNHPYMIIMNQHDALVFEVLKELVVEIMENWISYNMGQPYEIEGREWVFPVDIKHGKRFSDT